ncbi:hypothetical protein CC78DRAFT_548459 [Lojkania enalia]|uniref:Uncharacterized protein n=1 Tax=Lojkania enalia TaxID=147567 RepID=A0A9P4K4H1_9PLEO|nr:hypothetical protein CC78DRAFT_548459 [Didymosphaeria enalia]
MASPPPHSSTQDPGFGVKKRSRASEDCNHRRTRVKLSPPVSDSSASEPSISDESALIPTSVPEESTDASDADMDSESELSESSEEPSSESPSEDDSDEASEESELEVQEDQDEIVNLRADKGKKPKMKLSKHDLGPDLLPFLADFLPKLRAANKELEAQRKAGTLKVIETGDDGESNNNGDETSEDQYIEMNLGLGVLEEKGSDADDSSSDSDSDSEEGDGATAGTQKEKDIFGKLMGRERAKAAGIQEVADTDAT